MRKEVKATFEWLRRFLSTEDLDRLIMEAAREDARAFGESRQGSGMKRLEKIIGFLSIDEVERLLVGAARGRK